VPSLQQARREALAERLEASRRSLITTVASALWGVPHDPVPGRVERIDGSSIDLQLEEVQLDAAELRGRDRRNNVVATPLDQVKAVWVRRLRPRRAAAVYLAILGAAELFVVLFAKQPIPIVTLGVLGVALGVPLCAGAWIVLKRLKPFQEWVLVYDRTDGP